ncbi:MAG TPA: winged helix-turn-helix domain-containing protein [Actinomycetota bacterium]|nr:winged helix-turn-helix domain-containing protein [Actinomycetota bacterium]
MAQPDLDQRLAALASLGDPLRRELYSCVTGRDGGVGRDEAAAAVGVSRALAAYHLDKLVDAGLLDTRFERRTGRRGPRGGPDGQAVPPVRHPGRGRPARPGLRADRRPARLRRRGGPVGRVPGRAAAGGPRPRRPGRRRRARPRHRPLAAGRARLRALRGLRRAPAAQLPVRAAGRDPPGAGLPRQPGLHGGAPPGPPARRPAGGAGAPAGALLRRLRLTGGGAVRVR